jgi:hypothetical protein
MPLSESVMFRSEQFDYKSELPDEYNAGNRFYGKDLAEFLATSLTEQGVQADYLDEDWGWLVYSPKDASASFELAIYNLAEHGQGNRTGIGEWGLWIRAYERKKLLGVLPKRNLVSVPSAVMLAVQTAIKKAGAKLVPWEGGPGDA